MDLSKVPAQCQENDEKEGFRLLQGNGDVSHDCEGNLYEFSGLKREPQRVYVEKWSGTKVADLGRGT